MIAAATTHTSDDRKCGQLVTAGIRCQEAGDEEQRIAGKEETDQKARFGEHDQRQQREAALVENLLRFEEIDERKYGWQHERGRLHGLAPISSESACPF